MRGELLLPCSEPKENCQTAINTPTGPYSLKPEKMDKDLENNVKQPKINNKSTN